MLAKDYSPGYGADLPFNPTVYTKLQLLEQAQNIDYPDDDTEVDFMDIDPPPLIPNHYSDNSYSTPVQASSESIVSFDASWLNKQCQIHISQFTDGNTLTTDQLSQKILQLLISSSSDDQIQNSLLDLIGFENFDLLTTLVSNRSKIVQTLQSTKPLHNQLVVRKVPEYDDAPTPIILHRPQYGAQVTVMSEAEKQAMKQARKDAKKRNKITAEERDMELSASMLGLEGDYLRQVRESQFAQNAANPLYSNPVSSDD